MTSLLTDPIAVVARVQPLLVLWLLAISFFATLSGVAIVSKGRSWYELACLFLLGYVVCSVVTLAGAHLLFEVTVVSWEIIAAPPAASAG
jgi:hypothetical protein